MVAEGRGIAKKQFAQSQVAHPRSTAIQAVAVVATTGHFELAGDVGQINKDGRIGVPQADDVQQQLFVVRGSVRFVVTRPSDAERGWSQTAGWQEARDDATG